MCSFSPAGQVFSTGVPISKPPTLLALFHPLSLCFFDCCFFLPPENCPFRTLFVHLDPSSCAFRRLLHRLSDRQLFPLSPSKKPAHCPVSAPFEASAAPLLCPSFTSLLFYPRLSVSPCRKLDQSSRNRLTLLATVRHWFSSFQDTTGCKVYSALFTIEAPKRFYQGFPPVEQFSDSQIRRRHLSFHLKSLISSTNVFSPSFPPSGEKSVHIAFPSYLADLGIPICTP